MQSITNFGDVLAINYHLNPVADIAFFLQRKQEVMDPTIYGFQHRSTNDLDLVRVES